VIAAWMLTATLFAAFVGLAALCADRATRAAGQATRVIWLVGIAAGVAWPVLAPLLAWLRPPSTMATTLPLIRIMPDIARSHATNGGSAHLIDRGLLILWFVASASLLIHAARAWVATRMVRQSAERRRIDGVDLLVSDGVGPAVVGVARPAIILPRDLLTLEAPLLDIIVQHEEEHRVARDSWIAFGCVVVRVLMPWNPALWWMTRRARLAVEIDCDRRVLRRGVSASRYGKLLLLIAQSDTLTVLSPALVSSRSHLEWRITAMLATRPANRRLTIAASLAGMVLAGIAACSAHIADVRTPPPGAPAKVSAENSMFEFKLDQQARIIDGSYFMKYPDALKANPKAGSALVQYVVMPDGTMMPGSLKIVKVSDPAFVASIRDALATARFTPAMVGSHAVKQLVQQPIEFPVPPQL
jgi:beta-lactamase regulating signal transducer with metallopeptidase domain